MVGKRKANSMMNQIAKIAKQIDEATEDAQKEAKPMTDEGWEKESKGEYFDRVMRSSSSLDRVLEFLRFRKQADKLLPCIGNDLVALVRREHLLLAGFNIDAVPVSVRDRMFQQHQCLVCNIQRIIKQNKDECNTVMKNWRERIKSWGEMCSRALYQVNFESKLYQKTLQLYLFLHKTRKHTKHRGDRTSNRRQKTQ